jgi:hypothetical protein
MAETSQLSKCRVTRQDVITQNYSIVVPDRDFVFIQYHKCEVRGTEEIPLSNQSENLTMKFEGQRVEMMISRDDKGISVYEPTVAPSLRNLSPRYRFESLDPETRLSILNQLSLEARVLLEDGIKKSS